MTNAEKYLKDGVNVTELANNLFSFAIDNYGLNMLNYSKCIADFFKKEVPLLTEDERVILRNVCDNYTCIGRDDEEIYLGFKRNEKNFWKTDFSMYDDLFQFIKERRRIFNRGVVEK